METSDGGSLRRWARRYLPAEALSLGATLLASWAALAVSGDLLLAALAGTWARTSCLLRPDCRARAATSARLTITLRQA